MPKALKKIRNWREYNKSLVKRGQILLSFDPSYIEDLYHKEPQCRGGRKIYTPKMYEYLLTIKVLLRLPWRATVGFARGLLQKAFPDRFIQVPDYAHASRAASKLSLVIKTVGLNSRKGMELAFDSTGLNVYSTSGYHQRDYGNAACRKREQWKKIHIVLELDSKQIVAMAYSSSRANDCEFVEELCKQVKGKITSARADGAYDTNKFYELLDERKARIIIPPAVTSKAQHELKTPPKVKKDYLEQRDNAINFIRGYETFEQGLKEWKRTSGYHRRSIIEATMFRLKRIFGFHLHHRTKQGRVNEMIIKINLLNQMVALGKAEYIV